jgi:predicted lipoprotein
MKKGLKYALGITILIVVAYNAVYFKKLDEVKASASDFDAKSFARNLFNNKITPSLNNAVDLSKLLVLIQSQKDQTFNEHSHALGIGNIRYFLVKGEGIITSVNENDVSLLLKTDTTQRNIRIITELVFGNAIRDASGQININDFSNTMDFNNVSSELNKIVRTEILPPFKAAAKKGDYVRFVGALELNKEHLNLNSIEIIPVQLSIGPSVK